MIQAYGLWVLFTVVMLESMGVAIPGETALVTAALYAGSTHQIGIASVVLVAATAAMIGDNIGYLIGRSIGVRLVVRYGKYVRLSEPRLKVGQYLFLRHGGKIVFFGRFVAFLRTFAALLAGVNRMSWPHFLIMNALGGICWASLFGGGAYLFGEQRLGRSACYCWSRRLAWPPPASSFSDTMRRSWSSARKQPFRGRGCNEASDQGPCFSIEIDEETHLWFPKFPSAGACRLRQQHIERQSPHRGCGIELLGDRDERHPMSLTKDGNRETAIRVRPE